MSTTHIHHHTGRRVKKNMSERMGRTYIYFFLLQKRKNSDNEKIKEQRKEGEVVVRRSQE